MRLSLFLSLSLSSLDVEFRSDVSAKETSNADFELSVACLINRLLCDEELFGPGMRCGYIFAVQIFGL